MYTKKTKKNEVKFTLKIKNLKPCDIILIGEKTPKSMLIQFVTSGQYSHAMLYVGNSILHATLKGVFADNPQRMHFSTTDNVVVMRLKAPLSQTAIDAIIKYARTQVGKQYSISQATTVILGPRIFTSPKQFCSRLIAQAFLEADIKIVSTPEYCSPVDIFRSELFETVENSLCEANEDALIVARQFNPIEVNHRCYYEWLDKTRVLARKFGYYIASEETVSQFLEMYPQHSDEVSDYIRESGYLENYKYEKTSNPYRFSTRLCRKMCQQNREKAIMLFIHDSQQEIDVSYRFINNYLAYSICKQNSFTLTLRELYLNLVNHTLQKLTVFEEILRSEDEINYTDRINYFIKQLSNLKNLITLQPEAELTHIAFYYFQNFICNFRIYKQ